MPTTIDFRDLIVHYGSIDVTTINIAKKISVLDYGKEQFEIQYFEINSLSPTVLVIKYDETIIAQGPVAHVRAMARRAAQKLGHPIPRTSKVWCLSGKAGEKVSYALFVVLATSVLKPQWIEQLGTVKGFSSIAGFLLSKGKTIFSVLYSIHSLEVLFVMIPKLRAYGVPCSKWPAWIIMNFIEGVYAIKRFNQLTDSDFC